jgi:hypothetical protein
LLFTARREAAMSAPEAGAEVEMSNDAITLLKDDHKQGSQRMRPARR